MTELGREVQSASSRARVSSGCTARNHLHPAPFLPPHPRSMSRAEEMMTTRRVVLSEQSPGQHAKSDARPEGQGAVWPADRVDAWVGQDQQSAPAPKVRRQVARPRRPRQGDDECRLGPAYGCINDTHLPGCQTREVCRTVSEGLLEAARCSGGSFAPVPPNVGNDTGDRDGRANRGCRRRAKHPAPLAPVAVDLPAGVTR